MTLSSLLAGASRSELIESLLFACLSAFLGYRMSHRHRLVRGVTPWHVPSFIWALICFFFLPFGIFVELLAQATTKPAVSSPASPRMPRSVPAFGQRAAAPGVPPLPVAEEPVPVPVHVGPPPPEGDGTGKTPLFGWYRDVTGRHEERYWDGRGWSEHVRDQGAFGVDPIPDAG